LLAAAMQEARIFLFGPPCCGLLCFAARFFVDFLATFFLVAFFMVV
jgi:hypothetical protein